MRDKAWMGQWLAALMVGCGIGVEIGMGADAGYVAITAGSLVFALATKLRRGA